ncbi:MAG TPA: arginine deiminase-related protein [Dokdonella sp.]|uniref:arginine deiminase-related protein n=1 Tax=Dokdonella sp. TaxID=2291710 RepID=UPI002D7E4962|nr:arginine deiminase-related protein [Dokdonella sp.]HET9032952.1 arginine deiminase-related protein [Dokdonella sp.]
MIVTDAQAFLDAVASRPAGPQLPATAKAAFLVSPIEFSLAAESASDNRYMDLDRKPDALHALAEHAELARRLSEDVPLVTFPGDPKASDGVFPNNAFATTPGRLIIGRMRHAVRQRETARADIRNWLGTLQDREVIDLSGRELVAELTGALVIDRSRGIGYCGLSERCDMAGARAMHEAFGLRLSYCFELAEGEYHTNVVLAILAGRAAIIAESGFRDSAAARAIASLYAPNIVSISDAQKQAFAANAISLSSGRVWMSARAASSLSAEQIEILERSGFVVGSVELAEIEKAGGSLRCCVGEIF